MSLTKWRVAERIWLKKDLDEVILSFILRSSVQSVKPADFVCYKTAVFSDEAYILTCFKLENAGPLHHGIRGRHTDQQHDQRNGGGCTKVAQTESKIVA